MNILSLDPRVNRMELDENKNPYVENVVAKQENWHTYEVFHQKRKGMQHIHVGIVHAPSSELALSFAKEQYARRGETANLWVVKSTDIVASDYADTDIFSTTPEKTFREASGYKVMDKINAYKKSQKES